MNNDAITYALHHPPVLNRPVPVPLYQPNVSGQNIAYKQKPAVGPEIDPERKKLINKIINDSYGPGYDSTNHSTKDLEDYNDAVNKLKQLSLEELTQRVKIIDAFATLPNGGGRRRRKTRKQFKKRGGRKSRKSRRRRSKK